MTAGVALHDCNKSFFLSFFFLSLFLSLSLSLSLSLFRFIPRGAAATKAPHLDPRLGNSNHLLFRPVLIMPYFIHQWPLRNQPLSSLPCPVLDLRLGFQMTGCSIGNGNRIFFFFQIHLCCSVWSQCIRMTKLSEPPSLFGLPFLSDLVLLSSLFNVYSLPSPSKPPVTKSNFHK